MPSYIYSVMRDKKKGFLAGAAGALLSAVSVFYLLLVTLHHFLYKKGILKTSKVSCKVISVGNITLGGTGKTPFTSMLVSSLKEKGRKAAVLIRGWGEDEWKMLKSMLKDAPVLVGRDRVRSARRAVREYRPEVIVLDDGFQHRRLHRDVDILLIDSACPFGNRKIFPRGTMREPAERIKDADLVVLSKIDKGSSNAQNLYEVLKTFKPEKDILEGYHKPTHFIDIKEDAKKDLSSINGKSVCIVSSIADPEYFRYTVENLGANVSLEFKFPDHYNYKEKDIRNIGEKCKDRNVDYIITTEKDLPKIRNTQYAIRNTLLALHIEFEITKGKEALLERCL